MIIVYNKELTNFKEITHAISIQMLEYYNKIGKAILTLPVDDYNISAIENDGVIYDTVRDMSFTIQNYRIDTNENTITVNAYTCNWLLNKRVLAAKKYFSNVEKGVYEAVSANLRGLPHVSVASVQGFTERSDAVLYGGQLLDKLIPVMEAAGIGHKMVWNPDTNTHIFTQYKGRDLSEGIHAVTFSDEQGTANALVITSDNTVLKNHIYVQGQLRDDTEIIEEVGSASDADKSELWLRNTYHQGPEESEEELRARMRSVGYEEMAARIAKETFSVYVDASEYGKFYKLGDIVSAVSLRFGVTLKCKITGAKYVLGSSGETINLILGEPILTALEEVKLNGN